MVCSGDPGLLALVSLRKPLLVFACLEERLCGTGCDLGMGDATSDLSLQDSPEASLRACVCQRPSASLGLDLCRARSFRLPGRPAPARGRDGLACWLLLEPRHCLCESFLQDRRRQRGDNRQIRSIMLTCISGDPGMMRADAPRHVELWRLLERSPLWVSLGLRRDGRQYRFVTGYLLEGLHILQNRGYDSAGITTCDGDSERRAL